MDNKQFSVNILHKPTKPNGNEWRFYEFGIACVFPTPTEPTDNADPINIAPLIQGVIDYELTNKDGFFCKSYSPQKEDESLDELLCVDVYGMKCSFQPFLSELKTFGVTDLFGQDLIKCIFQVLNEIGRFIKDNTDKPQAIKNHIISMLDVFGNIQIVSAMARITVMRGLEMFYMECLDTIEGYGAAEVEDILMWVALEECKMISAFTILPFGFGALSRELAEHIKPFTDYLYSTETGKMANDITLASLSGQISTENNVQLDLPQELNTDRARKYFAKAIEVGYMKPTDNGFKWVFGGERGSKARLAYFLVKVYCPKVTDTIQADRCRKLERLFNVERLDRAIQQNDDTGKSETVKKWKAEISELFNE